MKNVCIVLAAFIIGLIISVYLLDKLIRLNDLNASEIVQQKQACRDKAGIPVEWATLYGAVRKIECIGGDK